jgi:hypothetical protein
MAEQGKRPILTFCYAPEKDRYSQQLLEQVLRIKLSKRVEMRGHYSVFPGQNWQAARERHFEEADVIVLLISADFWASDLCREEVVKYGCQVGRFTG